MNICIPPTPDPTLFCGTLSGQTERDRDMKLSGFVDLIMVDVKMYVRNWSDQKNGPFWTKNGPKWTKK